MRAPLPAHRDRSTLRLDSRAQHGAITHHQSQEDAMQFAFEGTCRFKVPPTLVITSIECSSGIVTVNADVAPQALATLTCAEKFTLDSGRKILAIKSVRERTGLGLKEAKDLCDAYTPMERAGDVRPTY